MGAVKSNGLQTRDYWEAVVKKSGGTRIYTSYSCLGSQSGKTGCV